jgi:hypothetical protein
VAAGKQICPKRIENKAALWYDDPDNDRPFWSSVIGEAEYAKRF